jgi:cell division protein FtsL
MFYIVYNKITKMKPLTKKLIIALIISILILAVSIVYRVACNEELLNNENYLEY